MVESEVKYTNTIALNNGSLLVEIDNQTLDRIENLKDKISI